MTIPIIQGVEIDWLEGYPEGMTAVELAGQIGISICGWRPILLAPIGQIQSVLSTRREKETNRDVLLS